MTDFEIQRRLRDMATSHAPHGDLWPAIAMRIATAPQQEPATRRSRPWLPLAAAAALVVAFAGSLSPSWHRHGAVPGPAMASATDPAAALRMLPRDATGFANAPHGDPRLVGAAVVLDAAHAELEQALEQRPDAVFLVGLLDRTHARRARLDHFSDSAG